MIVSASRRSDIPAFYATWFMNRIRAGYCAVPNPFNRNQVSHVSLRPDDVDAIVFWTRNPRPLMPHLDELDARGYRYYFQYTLMDNPRAIDPKSPPTESAISTFRELAERVGTQRVIWRYDPIVFSEQTSPTFHLRAYEHIAGLLRGYTRRSVISLVDVYRKAQGRLRNLASAGIKIAAPGDTELGDLVRALAQIARRNDMEIVSCAEDIDLQPFGIMPGKCVDDAYIAGVFGLDVTHKKDPAQREACGCVVSRDIGMYDSCLFGCQYCYATSSFERARVNYNAHDPNSPSLIGWYDAPPPPEEPGQAHLWG